MSNPLTIGAVWLYLVGGFAIAAWRISEGLPWRWAFLINLILWPVALPLIAAYVTLTELIALSSQQSEESE